MARVLVAIRFPEELKKFIDEACARRGVTITSFVVKACWGELEEPQGTRVVATPSADTSSNVNETKAAFVINPSKPYVWPGENNALTEALLAVEPDRPMCAYREYDEQSGETMACGLAQHGAKVRHGNWRRV